MSFPRVGPAHNTTANLAGGPYGAWSGTNSTGLIGPAGSLVSIGGGGVALYDGANSITSGTALFSNANGVTFGIVGNTITASIPAVGGAQTGISSFIAGGSTQSVGAISFGNANGVTFGLVTGANTGTLTASVAAQSVQTQTAGNIAQTGFATTTTNGSVILGTNVGGFTLAVPSYLTTYVAQTTQTQPAGAIAGTNFSTTTIGGSAAAGTLNSSGLTLALPAWVTAGGGNQASIGVSTGGNTLGNTGIYSGQVVFAGGNNITLSVSSGAAGAQSITISGANAGGAQTGISGLQVSNTTYTSGTVTFQNANGISFGSSGANGISASYTVPAAQTGISGIQVSNTTYTSGTVTWQNANGISFGSSGANGVSASYTVPSTAGLLSAINISGSNTSSNLSAVAFSNGNGVSFGLSTAAGAVGTITASVAAAGGAQTGISSIAAAGGTQTVGMVSFINSNGISFGMSTGANTGSMTASYTVPSIAGLISGLNVSGGAGNSQSNVTGITFANSNGLTFGVSTGANVATITGSYSQSAQAFSAQGGSSTFSTLVFTNSNGFSFSNTGGSIWGSYTVPTQSNQSIGMYAVGNTTQNSSTTLDARTLSFDGLGAQTVGFSNGSIQLSVPATPSLSGTGLVSISVNASTISIGVAGSTVSVWRPPYWGSQTPLQIGNGSIQVFPAFVDAPLSVSRADLYVSVSGTSFALSSYGGTLSAFLGLYTRNASTLSLASSGSQSYSFSLQSAIANVSLFAGLRNVSLPIAVNAAWGDLWIAVMTQTASANTAGFTASNMMYAGPNNTFAGLLGAGSNATQQLMLGYGVFSASSAALPASMAFSALNGSASNVLVPAVVFHNVSA
jgi:hypothetical protein